jgi:MOSC domain-containing protein YiiM
MPNVLGTVAMLLMAESAGAPMVSPESVDLVPSVGIVGDRYALHTGHWSDPQWPDQELTLIEAEVLERLDLTAEQVRRNVVTRGVRLSTLIQREFMIGETRLFGVRICDPCRYIERFTRKGAMDELGLDGGLRVRIMTSGTIRVGDSIREDID